MTKVPQLDWAKLMPEQPRKRQIVVKKRYKRVKPKDKNIFREAYDQRQHLRSIINERTNP